jgi:hypothetical protein
MISQAELKTLVPSVVMSGVLLYEAISGNAVSSHLQNELTNGILIGAGYMVTLWGIWQNHRKTAEAKTTTEVTPPKIPPDQTGVKIENVPRETSSTPIVTQEDLNKKLGG